MELVLAVVAGFVLASYIWPQVVKSRPHFVLAAAAVLLALMLQTLAILFGWMRFLGAVFAFLSALSDVAAFALLLRSASGLTLGQWLNELGSAISSLGR